jgi:hypothetical protein
MPASTPRREPAVIELSVKVTTNSRSLLSK